MSIYKPLKIYDPTQKIHLEFERAKYLQSLVFGKSVLHVGCTDYPITEERIKTKNLLHCELKESARTLLGIDNSEKGVNILRSHGFTNVTVMDAEELNLSSKFEIILAGDVLEHMNNPGKFIEKSRHQLCDNGELIIGVPSALTINNLKAWLGGWEQVHCDHTFYFSPKTLAALCGRYGLLPTRLVFTVQPQYAGESNLFCKFKKGYFKNF